MEKFLEETKKAVDELNIHNTKLVHIVLGNEACDLDSVISTLVYGYYLVKAKALQDKLLIPVVNIKRDEFSLRTEVTFFLKENNVSFQSLVFRDDLNLRELRSSGRLSLTLVDHNLFPHHERCLQDCVTEIIDHHKLELKSENSNCEITLEPVGSCCTLVAEKILNDEHLISERLILLLLYGTILLDTICLNENAKRVTAKDKLIAEKLEAKLPDVDRVLLFQSLHTAKFDVSGLSMNELLLKDLKVISNNTMNLAIASICTSLEGLLQRPDAETDLNKFASSNNYQIVILMGLQVDPLTQETTRHLAVFSSSQGYKEQIVDLFEAVSNRGPKLKLQSVASPYSTVVLYRQNNVAASRKVILPLLNIFLLGDRSPSVSSDTCSGVCSNTNSTTGCCKEEPSMNNGSHTVTGDEPLVNYDPLAAESEDVFILNEAIGNTISHLHVLGIGDPISHAGSSQSSSNQNSCPYTPQNSCTDGGLELDPYARQILPSFNSREMMEKIESKRGKLRGYEGGDGDAADNTFYPFTPKNSFVDGNFEAYIKNVPSFDSGDLLLKVNEKVASLDSTSNCDQLMTGSITVEVPQVVDRNIKNVQLGTCTTTSSSTTTEESQANTKDKLVSQQCPEGVSLSSDKLDKSDEKMDTSETSGSNSDKTSPFPNDLELQNPTAMTNTTTTSTTTVTATNNSSTITGNISLNHNNLIQKTCTNGETSPAPQPRTDSSASISSIQTDVDLDLAANYQTETVDFPDSPRQLKFLTQSLTDMQGLSLEETVLEEDEETEQPDDDDVFRAVLSPSSDGAVLKKEEEETLKREKKLTVLHIELLRSSQHDESFEFEDSLLSLELDSDTDFEKSILVMSANDSDVDDNLKSTLSIQNAKDQSDNSENSNITSNVADDSFRVLENLKAFANRFSTPKNKGVTRDMPSKTMSPLEEEEVPSLIEANTQHSMIASNTINLGIAHKLLSCFESEKVKDIHAMSKKIQITLEKDEIQDILDNSQLYAEYFGCDVFQALYQCQIGINDVSTENTNKKSIINLDKTCLDKSIAGHFTDELQLNGVFESSKALRRISRSHLEEPQSDHLYVKPHGQGAFFVESRAERRRSKQRIPVTFTLNLDDTLSSPEADRYIEEETNYNNFYENISSSSSERPTTLNATGKKKRKIKVTHDILNNTSEEKEDEKSLSSLSNKSDGDILSPIDDIATPDDIDTPDELDDSVTDVTDPIPEMSAAEERDEERRWRTCVIGGVQRKIDLKVIEPYKKVLSHGGYYGPKRSAIIVFSACYLPDHSRKDYDYVMDNLFLYVLTTLDQLVAEDYVLVYLHGALERNNMPTFGWLKRCYQMIDRRLRKNLKGLYLVHPTFWLKTLVVMTKPFISSKFARKLQFVNTLEELSALVPIDQMSIPDKVKQLEFEMMIKDKKKKQKQQRSASNRSESSSQELEGNNVPDRSDTTSDSNQIYRRFHAENLATSNVWF